MKLNKIEPTTCEIEQYMGANREKYGSFHSLISGLGGGGGRRRERRGRMKKEEDKEKRKRE